MPDGYTSPVILVYLDTPEVTITQVGDRLQLVSANELYECGVNETCPIDWSHCNPEHF